MERSRRTKLEQSPLMKFMSRAITIVCLAVFIYSAYSLISIYLDYQNNRQVLADAQEIYYEFSDVEIVEEDLEDGEIRPQFNDLQSINNEIVGWVSIEDTQINYPVLQAENNEDYLNRNYKGDHSIAGSIFMDYRIDIGAHNQNTILYGHRMKDGSMFEELTKFLNEDFFDNHQVVKFDTLYESYDAEIFSVYQTTTDFDYIQTEFAADGDFGLLLDEIRENSLYHTDIQINEDDQIITLSTCDYELDPREGRLVVHAKLVKKE
jgi:sortase B